MNIKPWYIANHYSKDYGKEQPGYSFTTKNKGANVLVGILLVTLVDFASLRGYFCMGFNTFSYCLSIFLEYRNNAVLRCEKNCISNIKKKVILQDFGNDKMYVISLTGTGRNIATTRFGQDIGA